MYETQLFPNFLCVIFLGDMLKKKILLLEEEKKSLEVFRTPQNVDFPEGYLCYR